MLCLLTANKCIQFVALAHFLVFEVSPLLNKMLSIYTNAYDVQLLLLKHVYERNKKSRIKVVGEIKRDWRQYCYYYIVELYSSSLKGVITNR